MTGSRLLLVEEDAGARRSTSRFLEREGFAVSAADTGAETRRLLSEAQFDLVLMDLKIPDEDGLSLLAGIRATNGVPIIVVSGRSKAVDRVLGLEMGADDYVSKPFNLSELRARIKAVLRRTGPVAPEPDRPQLAEKVSKFVRFAELELDLGKQELRSPDGSRVALTAGEFKLLEVFLRHPSRVLNRDQLLDWVANRTWTPYDRSIDTQIQRLRKKLEASPRHPKLIRTVRGSGYIFTPKVEFRESIGP